MTEILQLTNSIEARYKVDLYLYFSKFTKAIIVSKIAVDENCRNEGIGSKVMTEICEFADSNKLKIALTPSRDFGGSKTRLIKFYKRFGFQKYKGYELKESMIRNFQ